MLENFIGDCRAKQNWQKSCRGGVPEVNWLCAIGSRCRTGTSCKARLERPRALLGKQSPQEIQALLFVSQALKEGLLAGRFQQQQQHS